MLSTVRYSLCPVCRPVSMCAHCLGLHGPEQAETQAEKKLRIQRGFGGHGGIEMGTC